MDNNSSAKKEKITLAKILRRPIVKIAILVVLIILAVVIIKNISKNKKPVDTDLVGYQKLVNITDNVYTFVDLDGKVKTYQDYSTMSDFYFNTASVSKVSEDGITQAALINNKNKEVVKYGTYDNFIQVVGGKYYKVEKDGKYGVIDYKGKTIINPEYEYISITTVQEATELVFECQKDGKYYFVNEKGATLMDTDTALHSISYSNKFNSEYDTVIYISIDGAKRYFDLQTGEELFAGQNDVNFSYNVLKTDGKISFYDKNCKLKEEIDTSGNYSTDIRVYFKKYIVLEQRTMTSGTRENKYTVYDSNFNKLFEESNKVNPVEAYDGKVYFIVNDSDGVKIINENKKQVKVDGYEFNGTSISDLQNIVLNVIGDTTKYEAYDFKGKKLVTDISDYSQKGFALLIGKYDGEGQLARSVILEKGKEIAITDNENVIANDYYVTIEDQSALTVSVVNAKGNMILEKVPGVKVFYVEKYIGIQDGDIIKVYSTENGKQTFEYNINDYVNRDEVVNVIELTSGYYTFAGKTIKEKAQ